MTDLEQAGPTLEISEFLDQTKYRQEGESFRQKCNRIADSLKDNEEHFQKFKEILLQQKFLPAGRVQSAMGAAKQVTPYNCFVSGTIPDSMPGIMDAAKEAAETMRLGGGIGYDFSTLRPRGDLISRTGSPSSGPVSFMRIFDAVCSTVASAGHRRGAQMGVLRIDHPDVEEFIRAKQNKDNLTQFNVSLGVTDEFMNCVLLDKPFDLVFKGRVYKTVSAKNLFNEVMRSTWDWAEPGVLFIDRINEYNNLKYIETIAATNPCAEQPLPPYGACLLGSFNLVKYVRKLEDGWIVFDIEAFKRDIPVVVRAMDNIVDRALYPLEQQAAEAKNKRRMGIGVTGVANALEAAGMMYGDEKFLSTLESILKVLTNECYRASAELAKEKGPFPLYDENYLLGKFVQERLDDDVKELIRINGIRNSHLTSIAPTGTISLVADNVSSGIEPVYEYETSRIIQMFDGPIVSHFQDYGKRVFNKLGKRADECSVADHLAVLLVASKWVDSAVSKTCNVGDSVTFEEFKDIYLQAWKGGAKGCTTFRKAGKRMGIFVPSAPQEGEGAACYFDPETGTKSCDT